MDARFFGQLRVRKKPEYAQPVIEADNDDPFLREILAVIARLGARSGLKSAAVKPHHYREAVLGRFCRRPDIQVQAILAHGLVRPVAENHVRKNWCLHAARPESTGLQNALP